MESPAQDGRVDFRPSQGPPGRPRKTRKNPLITSKNRYFSSKMTVLTPENPVFLRKTAFSTGKS
jgi:hypothetical protein